jgi:hypothetical protein
MKAHHQELIFVARYSRWCLFSIEHVQERRVVSLSTWQPGRVGFDHCCSWKTAKAAALRLVSLWVTPQTPVTVKS